MRHAPSVVLLIAAALGWLPMSGLGQTFENVHRCDELAAHPDDPGRWANGVYDDDIVPGPAIKFCGEAAEAYPDTPRFHFQHGRALWAGQEYEKGVAAFLRAEAAAYGPAYAYLGDAYLHGTGGVETDEKFARTLYTMAAEAGFAPAVTVLADISALEPSPPEDLPDAAPSPHEANGQTNAAATSEADLTGAKSDLLQTVEEWQRNRKSPVEGQFNAQLFSRGQRLKTLYEGDFERLAQQEEEYRLVVYFMKLNEYFSQEINWHNTSCSAYFDPDLGPGVMGGMMQSWLDPRNLNQNATTVLQMMQQMTQNPGSFMGRVASVEAEQNAATKDGVMLAQEYGCENPVFERLYSNMANFLRGQPPAAASGWQGVQVACVKHAQANGSAAGQAQKYCECMTQEIAGSNVPISVGEWLQSDYDHGDKFGAIVAEYPQLRKKIGSCLL